MSVSLEVSLLHSEDTQLQNLIILACNKVLQDNAINTIDTIILTGCTMAKLLCRNVSKLGRKSLFRYNICIHLAPLSVSLLLIEVGTLKISV